MKRMDGRSKRKDFLRTTLMRRNSMLTNTTPRGVRAESGLRGGGGSGKTGRRLVEGTEKSPGPCRPCTKRSGAHSLMAGIANSNRSL